MIGLRRSRTVHGRRNSSAVETVRIVRPTIDLDRILRFYVVGLGLELCEGSVLDRSRGARVALPGAQLELAFIQVCHAPAPPPAGPEAIGIVLHVHGERARDHLVDRLRRSGFPLLRTDSPSWFDRGIAVADPDGWIVVITASS